jgi:hypothetical protein
MAAELGASKDTNPEETWEGRAALGCLALDIGLVAEARRLWWEAGELVDGFAANDPRRAASATHAALLSDLAGDERAAELFAVALDAWQAATAWVAAMAFAPRARSSTFHVRLSQKHSGGYEHLAVAGARRLLGAGQSAALAGGAHLGATVVQDLEHARALRARGLGYRDKGLARIDRALSGYIDEAEDAERVAALSASAAELERDGVDFDARRFVAERGAAMTDERRLKAAVYLTPMLPFVAPA